MIKRYRISTTTKPPQKNNSTANFSKDVPTFREFIRYITDEILDCKANEINSACLKDQDVHWIPVFQRCSPCHFRFDVISKVRNVYKLNIYYYFYRFYFLSLTKLIII